MSRVGQMLGIQLGNSAAALSTCILSIWVAVKELILSYHIIPL